jgi:hypothetical protein
MFIGGNFCRARPAANPILPTPPSAQTIEISGTCELARLLQ